MGAVGCACAWHHRLTSRAGVNLARAAPDTTDEVWLELLSPPKKAQRVVLVWGDQTYKQLGLPSDHEYTDFALETKGAWLPCVGLCEAVPR